LKVPQLHSWTVTPAEAVAIQERLRHRVRFRDAPRPPCTVGGLDVSYDRRSPWLFAAIVVLRLPDLAPVESAAVRARATFPYVPGLLSFREAPAGLLAWARLARRPDCLLCDGQGYAHPRRFGLACHFGLLVGRPTIGVAKSLLVGEDRGAGAPRGSAAAIVHHGEVVGMAVRTRAGAKPVYVSTGHRITLERAVATVLACAPRFRIPEPIRQAHALVNRLRTGMGG
jgi:deoxyribonuclease V